MGKFLSCDWGTSSFRLRLVNSSDHSVAYEYHNDFGIQKAFNGWRESKANDPKEKQDFYLNHINGAVRELEKISGQQLEGWLIICSGMASSSMGIKELPYVSVPFDTSGIGMKIYEISAKENFNHPMVIISGIKNDHNVMRGEETQLIGLISQLPDFEGEGVFIFPGTHSKHIYISSGQIVDFDTFMTGEVFKLLCHNSVLSNSIEGDSLMDSEEKITAFNLGLKHVSTKPLLSVLFNVRTNDLFGHLDKKQNFHYLSGLMIGNELGNLANIPDKAIYLCSEEKLYQAYSMALDILEIPSVKLLPELVSNSVVQGQYQIYHQNFDHERRIFLGGF
ncbi:MAG: 2-dehydro-3-deoxygalactonokinase [Cyclobacteriaceae bacterium]